MRCSAPPLTVPSLCPLSGSEGSVCVLRLGSGDGGRTSRGLGVGVVPYGLGQVRLHKREEEGSRCA